MDVAGPCGGLGQARGHVLGARVWGRGGFCYSCLQDDGTWADMVVRGRGPRQTGPASPLKSVISLSLPNHCKDSLPPWVVTAVASRSVSHNLGSFGQLIERVGEKTLEGI